MRSKENPFKFGTIVDGEFFTDRIHEVKYIEQYIRSANHLVLISPRRFGKSSVVSKALKESGRESITINLQQVTSVLDFWHTCKSVGSLTQSEVISLADDSNPGCIKAFARVPQQKACTEGEQRTSHQFARGF